MNTNLSLAHKNMLVTQIREQFMLDTTILSLFAELPRHAFVPPEFQSMAYAEIKIPIGHRQVMLTPNEEARILQSLNLKHTDRVLEIGTGTGYFTALLAKLCSHIDSVDIYADFTEKAHEKLQQFGINNVELFTADAAMGFDHPRFLSKPIYDVICITASLPLLPKNYMQSLSDHGRLFTILGIGPIMLATIITRDVANQWQENVLFETNIPEMIHAQKPDAFVF